MDQAQHIWKMLDDMAASDPEAYKKFVQQNIQTGVEEMNKERQEKAESISITPNFGFCMKIYGNLQKQCINELEAKLTLKQNEFKQETFQIEKAEKRVKFYVNILHHERVLGAFDKNDKPTDDPKSYNLIPLSVQNVQIGKSTSFGTVVYFYDIVVNSTVLNKINKQLLQTIVLDTLQKRIELDRNPLKFTFYRALYKFEMLSLKVISKPYKYCGPKKTFKIVLEPQADKDGRNAQETVQVAQKQTESFTKQLDQIVMPQMAAQVQQNSQSKKPLIEVIDDKPYQLQEEKDKITIFIDVDVESFQDIDLSVSQYGMRLETKNGQKIEIDFKCRVDDCHPQAKWDRKKKQLRVIVNKLL